MNSDFSPELQAELIDDFHAEADEYFVNIRAQLGVLEEGLRTNSFDPAALESLFRSMHSLKGISAIVGLREVEQLAHAAEDYLRQLSRGERTPTDDGVQILIEATHRLEQLVGAHRLKKTLPEIATLLHKLSAFGASDSSRATGLAAPAGASVASEIEAAQTRGLSTWRCVFSPSKSLDARGVNVAAIRTRLSAVGEILQAVPHITTGGGMSFEFVTAFPEPPSDLPAWEADGVAITLIETDESKGPAASLTSVGEDQSSGFFIAPSHIVRVDLSRLDELMRLTGELVIHRSRLDERLLNVVGTPARDRTGLQEVNLAMTRTLRDLRHAISSVRMVSMGEIFTRMPFVARDLARETGKKARLLLQGQQTEVDKYVVERLKEPLLHLVRNAFSHGIESMEERTAVGKPPEATVLLHAEAAGDWVILRIRDDGRGINAAAIVNRAAAQGLPTPAVIDHTAVLNLLCAPGFSTREEADRAAGRGVGMAVVQNAVRQLGGTVSMDTELGAWTEFTLRLPLTLSIIPVFIISLADQQCAVAQNSVEQIIQLSAGQIRSIQATEVATYREGLLPLVRLRKIFNLPSANPEQIMVVVVSSERGSAGLVVDNVSTLREVVVRPIQDPLIQVHGISGATELGDGHPVLILDVPALTSGVVRPVSVVNARKKEKLPTPSTLPV